MSKRSPKPRIKPGASVVDYGNPSSTPISATPTAGVAPAGVAPAEGIGAAESAPTAAAVAQGGLRGLWDYIKNNKMATIGTIGTGFMVGEALGGLTNLGFDIYEKPARQARERAAVQRSADLSAQDILTDYELSKLSQDQTARAIATFPSLFGGSESGPARQTPRQVSSVLPGEFYNPGATRTAQADQQPSIDQILASLGGASSDEGTA